MTGVDLTERAVELVRRRLELEVWKATVQRRRRRAPAVRRRDLRRRLLVGGASPHARRPTGDRGGAARAQARRAAVRDALRAPLVGGAGAVVALGAAARDAGRPGRRREAHGERRARARTHGESWPTRVRADSTDVAIEHVGTPYDRRVAGPLASATGRAAWAGSWSSADGPASGRMSASIRSAAGSQDSLATRAWRARRASEVVGVRAPARAAGPGARQAIRELDDVAIGPRSPAAPLTAVGRPAARYSRSLIGLTAAVSRLCANGTRQRVERVYERGHLARTAGDRAARCADDRARRARVDAADEHDGPAIQCVRQARMAWKSRWSSTRPTQPTSGRSSDARSPAGSPAAAKCSISTPWRTTCGDGAEIRADPRRVVG